MARELRREGVFSPIRIDANNPSPMTGAGNATYLLIATDLTATLIDAGVGNRDHLGTLNAHLHAAGARLTRVLVTHAHPDHASGAPAIAAAYPEASFFKWPWASEDAKHAVKWNYFREEIEFVLGSVVLKALHTPGHSPDHVAFWHEPTRTLFSGDLVVQASSVFIDTSRGGDLDEYLAALQRLIALRPVTLLPAHGPEIRDPEAVLARHLAHRMMRERQVLAALAAGCDTVPSIAESIYDGLNSALLRAAHENVRAHLEKLRREGRAFEHQDRWTSRHPARPQE